ncbi:MAG: response regulator [Candidatus Thiodiazotropha sp. (ex. Lucinisca nassula)]|nr:response regulator [Candidatus Thiodiazotropha sp. (ex. Lucinisca nassula)]
MKEKQDNRGSKILIVDDVADNLSVLSSLLQAEGFRVFAAISGNLALQALDTLVPDLILLDIVMPEMNGFEICARIKERESLRNIPVIFISALDDPQDKVKAFSSGGVDYIGKPFQKEEVLARVKTHIELAGARDKLETLVESRTHELLENQKRLKKTQQLARLGSWELDLVNGTLYWSDEVFNIFGLKPSEFVPGFEAFLERVHPEDRESVKMTYLTAVKDKLAYDLVHRIIRNDNDDIQYVHELADHVINEDGEVIRSIGTVQDITNLVTLDKERQHYLEKFKNSLEKTVIVVSATLEKRDPYTAGHQRNVSELAVSIAKELNLSDDTISGIRLGSIIHDIGKINIPSEILTRPGKLSDLEFEMIKTHPLHGSEILKDVEFPWPIAEMVLQHHERLDGSGYPNSLKGDEILLEAKIIAVADVVEAMSSHRPYRPSLGIEVALKEIEAGSGRLFDEKAVSACINLFREKDFKPFASS